MDLEIRLTSSLTYLERCKTRCKTIDRRGGHGEGGLHEGEDRGL